MKPKGETMPRIAVLLSGCGNMDGSELHESVSAIIAIDMKGWDVVFTAPDIAQSRSISHLTGQPVAGRNMLEESARIARGRIEPLSASLLDTIDAIVLPGGMGAATSLCNFATKGELCEVLPAAGTFLKSAHEKGIPIAAMCIAPAIVAKILPGVSVTMGTDRKTAEKIQKMGCRHVNCSAEQTHVDKLNRIITTPGYMAATGPYQVFRGALQMIEDLEELLSPS
jgi:enhancing lycopene biosynthesis protein 2